MASCLHPSTRLALAFWLLGFLAPLPAETVLYENGTMGFITANPIYAGSAVSDPFTITGGGVFNTIAFAHWTSHPSAPTSVLWRLSDTALFDGVTLASGTAALDSEFIQAFSGTLDVYRSSFSIPDFTAADGTQYWLTLYGADGSDPANLATYWGWAAGGAGNVASLYQGGDIFDNRQSHYFQLSYAVPEPSVMCLGMTGFIFVLAGFRRRWPVG